MAAAVALTVGVATAPAASHHHHERSQRVRTHLSLHLSGHSVLAGNGLAVRGKVRPSGRRRIKIVFRGAERGVVRTTTRANGTFAVRWKPAGVGSYAVRAFGVHTRRARGAVSKARHLTSFRQAGASWYGPGLYGNGVACGGTLTPGTLGVANKTLPCGTMVRLRYHGHSIRVPVIDRGPYVAGREYDLTEAVRDRLGFPGVGIVLADH
ncbi:MAG TPA: septal ring lytic transglycosylase RlpA family protein [Solirubrobacterales bacterium]|nr:septal ring lytic transglycosylase RlpA family protein [Solirubrobacterales bacterium]